MSEVSVVVVLVVGFFPSVVVVCSVSGFSVVIIVGLLFSVVVVSSMSWIGAFVFVVVVEVLGVGGSVSSAVDVVAGFEVDVVI